MASERVDQHLTRDLVEAEISRLDIEIGALRLGRRDAQLSDDERPQTDSLEGLKGIYVVRALEIRRDGDRSISLSLRGRRSEALHPFSHNQFRLEFTDNSGRTVTSTYSDLQRVRGVNKNKFADLLGKRVRFYDESRFGYILRAFSEIKEIDREIARTRRERPVESHLEFMNNLKIMLAKRVLTARAEGNIIGGRVEVVYKDQRDSMLDLLEISFISELNRMSFALPSFAISEQIIELVENSGGYNRVVARRYDSKNQRKIHGGNLNG